MVIVGISCGSAVLDHLDGPALIIESPERARINGPVQVPIILIEIRAAIARPATRPQFIDSRASERHITSRAHEASRFIAVTGTGTLRAVAMAKARGSYGRRVPLGHPGERPKMSFMPIGYQCGIARSVANSFSRRC